MTKMRRSALFFVLFVAFARAVDSDGTLVVTTIEVSLSHLLKGN